MAYSSPPLGLFTGCFYLYCCCQQFTAVPLSYITSRFWGICEGLYPWEASTFQLNPAKTSALDKSFQICTLRLINSMCIPPLTFFLIYWHNFKQYLRRYEESSSYHGTPGHLIKALTLLWPFHWLGQHCLSHRASLSHLRKRQWRHVREWTPSYTTNHNTNYRQFAMYRFGRHFSLIYCIFYYCYVYFPSQ